MITKMDGGTFRMLSKDKRVAAIKPAKYGDVEGVRIDLAPGWQNEGSTAGDFPDWESARNWVRKAVKLEVDA
jgi:hypothetical protein